MKFSTFYKILISHKKITKTVIALLCSNLLFATSRNEIVLKANTDIISANAQCLSGNSFDFNSSSTISSGSISSHTWKFGDGKTATGPSVTHSYFTAGIFSVTLIVTSDNGCIDSISKTVTVYPQPIASYIIPANQCLSGNNFNFISTASIASNSSISSQIWNFGDGNTVTGTNVNHSFAAEGNYPVNLQVTSDNGCIDIITDTITVFQMPIVSIPNIAAICSGNTLSLSASTLAGTAPYSYAWTGPNGFTAATANPSIANAGISANGTYSVSVTDSNSCSSSATYNMIVNQTPVLSPIIGPIGGCVGSSINLTNTVSGGIWTSSNLSVATINAVSGQVSFLWTGNTTIQYTVTNTGCASSVNTNLISNSVILHPDVIECNNGITHFSASDIYYGVTYSNNNPGNTYLWSITGGPFSFQGASNTNSAYPNVQLQSGNAFTALVQFTSNGITCSAKQMIYKNTSAADTIKGSHDTTVCNNTAAIQLSAAISPASNSFSWSSSGTGSFANNTSLNTSYTPSAADKIAGSLKIYFTATSTLNSTGNCGTAYGKDSMILRIYPANMAANSSQTICSNQTVLFTPVSSIPGSFYSWSSSVISGTANGNSATGTGQINDSLVNTNNSLDATIVYNITPFAFTPTNTTCTGNPFNYTVIIKPQPGITITNNNPTLCTGSTSNIQFNSSTVGNLYTWTSTVISGAINGNSSNAIASSNANIQDNLTNSFNANSKVRYYIKSVSNAGCSNIDSTDVLVYAQPTIANAGTDQVLCNVNSSILSANIPGIGIGSWNQINGPSTVVFGSPSSPFSTLSGLVSGNYLLEWTITNGNCSIARDTIALINATETFGGSINGNNTVCAGLNTGNLLLTGYAGSIRGWEYSTDGGISWLATAVNTTNSYTYTNLTTTTLYRAIVQNGTCAAVYSSVATITVNATSIPGTLSADTIVCISSNSGNLSLNGYTGSILRWESSTDAGTTWPNTINNTSNNYSFSNLTNTTLFRAVIQNGTCSVVTSNAVTIKVSALSIPGSITANNIVCTNNNYGILQLTANNGNVLNWESTVNGGGSWLTISNTSNHQSYTNLSSSTIYRAKIQNGACPPAYSNTVSITVLPNVSIANAGIDQKICNQTSVTLAANTASSGTGTWTSMLSNPSTVVFSNLNDPSTTITGLVAGSYQFIWTISNGICADSKDTVMITVVPATFAGSLAADAIVCATSNSNTLVLNGAIGSVLHWESSSNNGATWNTIGNSNTNYTYTNLSSTTSFRAQVQNQICPALYSNIVTVTVLPPVTIANAGTDQKICNQTTASLAANTASSGTGTWTSIPTNPSAVFFSNPNDHLSTVSGLVAGSYQFVWTISNGYCADSRDTVTVKIDEATNPGIISSDKTVCASANSGILNLNNYHSDILKWESSLDGNTWTNISNTTNTQSFLNLTNSTYYRAFVKNGVCESLYSNVVRVTVLAVTTLADAGPDTTLINGFSSYKLEGNMPSSGTGIWTVVPPYGPSHLIFTDPSDPTATIRPLTFIKADSSTSPITAPQDGAYHLKWTISNGVCPASESNMIITVQPPTNPGFAGPDTVVCANNNAGVVQLTNYFGEILQWEDSTTHSGGWHIITRTIGKDQDSLHFENLSTTTMYRALVKNGVGLSLYSGIAATITVLDPVSTANAGVDSSFCNTTSIQLYGNRAAIGTGTWTSLPNGLTSPIFSNIKDPNSIVSGLTIGEYQFVWTISNGTCANSTDTVTIKIIAPTVPGMLSAANIVCANNNTGVLHLNGYTGSVLGASYTIDNGLNWLPISNSANKDLFDYNNLAINTQYRVEVQNMVCPSLFSNIVTITVLAPVTIANAGTDQKICNQSTATLSANTPGSGTGKWTSILSNPSTVNFSNPNDPSATITGLVAGTFQFVWTISNKLCADSKDTVMITVVEPTINGALAADAIVCATAHSNTLVLNGSVGSVLHWESSTNNGASWDTITNNNNTYTYTNLSSTTSFKAQVQNDICPALYSNIVNITVLAPVTIANAGTDQQICNQSTATLAANIPSSGTGKWTSIANNPSAVNFTDPNDPFSTITGLVAGTYQFVWTVSNKLCNDSKDTVQLIIYPETIAGNLVADNFVCTNLNSGNLVLSNNNGSILQWESSIDNGINWTTIASSSNNYTYINLSASTTFRVLVSNGNCSPAYSNTVKINVTPISIPGTLVSTDTLVCSNYNSGSIHLSGNNGSILQWEYSVDNGSTWIIINNSTPDFQFTNLTKTTIYRAMVQSGVCAIAYSNSLKINVSIPTIPGTIIGNATVCKSSNTGKIILSGNNGSILYWEYSIDNGNTWTTIANSTNTIIYQNISSTTIYRAVVQNSVCSIAYTNSITVNTVEPVTISNAGPNQLICNLNTATTLNANNPVEGSGIWSFVKGPSEIFFTDATAANTIINGLIPGTYQLAWTIDNGVCASSTSNMNIVVDRLKVDFSLNAINDCGSTTYQFNDASKVFYGIANWKWTSAPGDTITSKNFTKNYTQAGQNKVSLTVQSNSGCTVTTGANFQVKVFDMPKASINAINEACKDQLLQLSSTLNSRDSIFSILWNLGNGINTKDSLVTVQYYSEGKYTIKLLVSTVNKCYDSSYKLITIRPLPVIVIPNENYVCKGDSIKLIATGASTYIWKDKQNNIICNSCETLDILPTANSSYSVIGYNQFGCSQIANTTVKIVHPMKINAVQLDTLCIGSSIRLNVTGAEKYIWQPDAGLSNYNSGNPIATPKSTTTYTVIGRDNQSCFADTAKIKLVVGNPTKINIGTDTTIQAGVPFRIAAMSYERENIKKWQWSGNATFSCIDCQTTIAKLAYDGDIMVTATNLFGCYSTDTLSIKTFCPSTEVFIPNAFSPDGDGINDILYVQGSGIKIIKDFRIYSRWGELVFERTNFLPGDRSNGWDGKIRGKMASHDVFVYICEVVCEKGVAATFKGNIAVLK